MGVIVWSGGRPVSMPLRLAVVAHSSSEVQLPSIPSIAGVDRLGEGGVCSAACLGQYASPDFEASKNLSLECLLADAFIPPDLQSNPQCTYSHVYSF